MTAGHSAFALLREQHIDSLNVTVAEYEHKKTGAMHYHIAADNPENVFLVGFRTVPVDSTGVAHILEHTALCGSQKYPVRDPFFMMIRRSLNTFMNAFTSSDWTAYPFASQNKKDFNNLLDVYLDAAFFSRLDPLDFAQEGHRIEFAKIDDPESELVYKGVVFNEMKGAMSSPVSTLWQTLTSHLFPTNTYHYNSGGEPECIPDLTHQQLKDFYAKHYHPSNAIFLTFGDIPAIEHQEKFEQQVLTHFDRSPVQISVSDEIRYDRPIAVEERYALDDDNDAAEKTHIVLGWLLDHSSDHKALLRAQLLSHVLLENSASPLLKALETTKLGSAPSPLCGLEDSNKEMTFICGIEGSKPEHAEALEKLVLDVLNDVAENGVPQADVEAVLHQIELSQREITGGSYPYGLQLILAALPVAIHRGDPIAMLNLDEALLELREAIKDLDYIKSLVKTHLLDNKHRVRLILKPDTGLSAAKKAKEKERLAKIKAALSDAEKQDVIKRSKALLERQAQEDDPSILPKVTISDIPKTSFMAEGEQGQCGSQPASFYAQGTNGLVYQDVVFALPKLNPELLNVMPFFNSFVGELGSGDKDYLAMQQWQSQISGGIHASSNINSAIDNVQQLTGKFILSGKALVRNEAALNALLVTTFNDMRFDEQERMRELVAQMRASREQSITGNGHSLAMMAASSGLSPSARLSHQLHGLAGIKFIKQLDASLKDKKAMDKFSQQLQAIHELLLQAPREFLLIGENDVLPEFQAVVAEHWTNGKVAEKFAGFSLPEVSEQTREMWLTSTQVNFCAKAFPTVPVDHPDAPVLSVLSGFLRNGYLHRAIREQGGAYGGGASHDTDSAAFRFYSYRDPRLQETLDDFDKSLEWLAKDNHEWQPVEEAILGVISGIDKPGSPAGEARRAFYNNQFGRTKEQRQRFRERVLAVTLADLQRVANTYLKPSDASIAVITNPATKDQVGDLGLRVVTGL